MLEVSICKLPCMMKMLAVLEVSISKLPGMMKSACCAGGINL